MRPFGAVQTGEAVLLNRIKSSHFTRSPFSWHCSTETVTTLPIVDTIPFYTVLEPFLASNAAVEFFQFTPQKFKCSMKFRPIKSDSRNEASLCGSFHAERQKRKKSTIFSLARFQLLTNLHLKGLLIIL